MNKYLLISIYILMLTGCSTIHQLGYVGIPKEKAAILSGPTNIAIQSIDGSGDNINQGICKGSFCGAGFELYLPEGIHKIGVLYLGYYYTKEPVYLEQYFEAGSKYVLEIGFEGNYVVFSIKPP